MTKNKKKSDKQLQTTVAILLIVKEVISLIKTLIDLFN